MSPPEIRTPAELPLHLISAADIAALIGAAYSADGLLLHESDLSPAFLDLRTGLLGELFQHLVNHRLPTAFVADFGAHGDRFQELAREHVTHPQVRFFEAQAPARAWLAAQARKL